MRALVLGVVLPLALVSQHAASGELRFRQVEGAGGVPLNVVEAGDPGKPGIILIHGIGQSYLSFEPQLQSGLAGEFHLVAFDLRAHGNSGKPWTAGAYRDTATWAEDVQRVMAATGLRRPVVLGWSYGTLVTSDYVRHVGTDNVAGIVLVGALGGLTPPPAVTGGQKEPDMLQRLRARQGSADLRENLGAADDVLGQLTGRQMPAEWRAQTLRVMAMVPAYARRLLWLRNTNNVDIIDRFDVPVLLVAGSRDAGVPREQAQSLAVRLKQGALTLYEESGHSPFAEEPERFNRELATFARRAQGIGGGP